MLENRIATIMGLASFALATFLGFVAGNSPETILWRAVITMMACYVVGWLIGYIAGRVVRDNVEIYRVANPIHGAQETLTIEEGEPVEAGEMVNPEEGEALPEAQENPEAAGAAL